MNKKILITFLIILILFGIIIRFISLNKDFTGEEVDFVKAAIAIKNTNHPYYYYSERVPIESALWHPPTYIYLMSLIFQFSASEISARSVNIFFSVLTAIVIFLFCSKIIGKGKGKIIGLISSAFFLVNYYVLSSSILIDIDMLSTFFVFSFIFFILRYYQTKEKYFLLFAGVSFFFGLANRYPMMILVYFFIGVYYYFNKELKKDFKEYFLTGIVSGIIFVIIWGIYSIFIEPGNFFSFIFHNIRLGSEQFLNLGTFLGSFALNISQFIRLFTFPATILMVWSFFHLFNKKSKLIKMLLIYTLCIFLFFIIIPRPAFGYPRYFLTIFPAVSILIGIFLYKNLENLKLNKTKILIFLFSFIISLTLLLILNPQSTIYASNGLIKATNLPDFCFNLLASLPLCFLFFIKKGNKRIIAMVILIALILSYSLYFDIKLINYKSHIKETGLYIKERTNESESIIVPKAISYYANRKFYANDHNKPPLDNLSLSFFQKYVKKSLENREMNDEFFWPGGYTSGMHSSISFPEEKLKEIYYLVTYHKFYNKSYETKIGDFYIYNLKA